ncbi:MAG: acyl-CoA dehydrogenase family protein [Dehalococcoidia bacterium]
MISFGLTEDQELIRETAREFAQKELREIARQCDEQSRCPDELLDAVWGLGLASLSIPERLGGGGGQRSPVTNAIVAEALGFGDVPLAAAALAPLSFVNALLDFGTAEQQAEYLPLFTKPRHHAATLALHESTFGFDPARLRTVAERRGTGFRITGCKRFVPLGDRASHFLVLARGEQEGLQGLEAFIVPRDASGLKVAADRERTLGLHALHLSNLELDGVEVGASARLGGESGIDGSRLIHLCRMGSSALAIGMSCAIQEFSIGYAKQRVAFGGPIARKQVVAFRLADMEIETNSMRLLVWKAASQLEQRLDAKRGSMLAHVYVCREAMKIADVGIQVLGGHGYIRSYPVEMWYRNMRALTLLEGLLAL